eukprot:1161636-Pelagomonas_calceolata.AAC.3
MQAVLPKEPTRKRTLPWVGAARTAKSPPFVCSYSESHACAGGSAQSWKYLETQAQSQGRTHSWRAEPLA